MENQQHYLIGLPEVQMKYVAQSIVCTRTHCHYCDYQGFDYIPLPLGTAELKG